MCQTTFRMSHNTYSHWKHWGVMMPNLSLLVAPEVVVTTTSGAASVRQSWHHDIYMSFVLICIVWLEFTISLPSGSTFNWVSFIDSGAIGSGDYTDLLWWNDMNNWFCQLITRVWDQNSIQMFQKPHILGSKILLNHAIQNGLQNLWGNIVFLILC